MGDMTYVVYKLKLAELGVKRPLLERPQLEGKPRADLLQPDPLAVLEDVSVAMATQHARVQHHPHHPGARRRPRVPVLPEENKVALVVERDDLPPQELGLLRE
jgi:hypothetical protein